LAADEAATEIASFKIPVVSTGTSGMMLTFP
jgi:hypothetical protein